jgi:energy-coupling factor transporter ATP-binding protein EcfA2
MDNGGRPTDQIPLLRTLAPALRKLEHGLRHWLDTRRRYPLSTITHATLEGLAVDLKRQAEALDVDRPLLVVMLMGGTGVGKSTLLNALAGGNIAQASFTRPTTRDPVVYYHESIKPDRLDPSLRHCRLIPHDRKELEHKILVDTPDLDSNDLANRDKLQAVLPVADIVLYVGSQEKYHDRLGWELFLQQRRRRAFAFVLNKWDRCLGPTTVTGLRPDEDLLRDLQTEGFENPLLFRTCAQLWVDRVKNNGGDMTRPMGEQFQDLVQWLEMGLTRLEIEAIKARGVSQLLHQLQDTLRSACPPDLHERADQVCNVWEDILREEAAADSEVLLNTLEPYQREIEHHFMVEGQKRFRGLMAGYLQLFTRMKYAGSTLRDRIPFLPRARDAVKTTTSWDLSAFTRACSDAAANRHLDARGKALANRLLVTADGQGFPLELLADPVESAVKLDWRQRHAHALVEVLHDVEQQWAKPTGTRRWLQVFIVWMANWVPALAFVAALVMLLWRYFDPTSKGYNVQLLDVFLPFVILLVVLIILQLLVALLLPLRWGTIRGEFQRQLEVRLRKELAAAYLPIPADVAELLREERRLVEQMQNETREVAVWLEGREQAASIAGLYGK